MSFGTSHSLHKCRGLQYISPCCQNEHRLNCTTTECLSIKLMGGRTAFHQHFYMILNTAHWIFQYWTPEVSEHRSSLGNAFNFPVQTDSCNRSFSGKALPQNKNHFFFFFADRILDLKYNIIITEHVRQGKLSKETVKDENRLPPLPTAQYSLSLYCHFTGL